MDRYEAIEKAIEAADKAYASGIPCQEMQEELDAAWNAAFLASLDASGFAVAPKEVTEEMSASFFKAKDEYSVLIANRVFPRPNLPAYIWRAMLAASRSEKEKAG